MRSWEMVERRSKSGQGGSCWPGEGLDFILSVMGRFQKDLYWGDLGTNSMIFNQR